MDGLSCSLLAGLFFAAICIQCNLGILVYNIKNQNNILEDIKDILECMKCNTSTNTPPTKTSKDIVDKIYENITSGSDIIDEILEDNGNN